MNVISSADLWFGGWDALGWPHGVTHYRPGDHVPDPVRYVVWVPPGRPSDELAPRLALHVEVAAGG